MCFAAGSDWQVEWRHYVFLRTPDWQVEWSLCVFFCQARLAGGGNHCVFLCQTRLAGRVEASFVFLPGQTGRWRKPSCVSRPDLTGR